MSLCAIEEYAYSDANKSTLTELRRCFIDSFYDYYRLIESELNLPSNKDVRTWLGEAFDEIEDEIIANRCRTIIARQNSTLVALLLLKETELKHKIVYISQLAVSPAYKRQSCGKKLICHLVNIYGRDVKYEILCRRVNQPGLEFYKKLGAYLVGNENIVLKYGYNPINYVGLILDSSK